MTCAKLWPDCIIIYQVRAIDIFVRCGLQAHELFVKWVPAHLGYSHGCVCEATICGANLSHYAIDLRHSGCYNATLTLASLTAHFSKQKTDCVFDISKPTIGVQLEQHWQLLCKLHSVRNKNWIAFFDVWKAEDCSDWCTAGFSSLQVGFLVLRVSNVCVIECLSVFHINLVATYTQK